MTRYLKSQKPTTPKLLSVLSSSQPARIPLYPHSSVKINSPQTSPPPARSALTSLFCSCDLYKNKRKPSLLFSKPNLFIVTMAVKSPLPLIFTVTLLSFLFLFTSAYARTPSAPPEDEVTISNTLTDLPESDPKSTEAIILPSEKSTVEFQPKTGSGFGSIEATEDTGIESAQLQFISFRPINRHFPRRPFHPFRYGKPCRHHHRRHPYRLKPWDPSFNGREISYGNDMILSGAEDVDSVPDPVSQGAVRQIPATWAQFRHGEPKYALVHDVERTKEMKRPYHDLHHHHHKRHVEDEEEEREETEEREEDDERKEKKHEHKDGLVKLFRKFVHHF